MNNKSETLHQNNIIKQFSDQAIPFTKLAGHYDAMQLLIELSNVSINDNVLDVACGPGIVACEFAKHCQSVKGIDITLAMIEQAKQCQKQNKLENISWDIGSALPLPYADNTFSLVITRYSFHHFLEPKKALAEMIRVCRPNGKILVADVAIDADKSVAYDNMEWIRDSSHTHALTNGEFAEIFNNANLINCEQSAYSVEIELESQLKASFPKAGDENKLRTMITNDINVNNLGINAYSKNNQVIYDIPIAVFVGYKKENTLQTEVIKG